MGEADLALGQTDEKPPDTGLAPGDDSVVWSHEVEVCLFHAMLGHKPEVKTLNPELYHSAHEQHSRALLYGL
ncbi:unnamed protein product [Merluccius merluccius]